MRLLKQSTARDVMVWMADSADHVSGKTGLTLTITASKAGAAFASITPTVTERGSGWYVLALTTADTDTLGDFALHITSTGADPSDVPMQVLAALPGEAMPAAANEAIADAVLGRSIAGGGNTGRLVRDALRFLRNKWSISGGTLTVTQEDDTTTAWTAAVTQTAGNPVSAVDPA